MGTEPQRHWHALALCLFIPLAGTSGCVYDYPETADTVTARPVDSAAAGRTTGPEPKSASARPYDDQRILAREAENYAELDRLLKAVPGPALLTEVGPLDGPLRGFGTMDKIESAGDYTVTAACVGASGATVSVGQEFPGAPFQPVELTLNCTGSTSQVISLQQGYVFAHLRLPGPGETPWTGAVGGVRLTR
ncbi:hypothetical protein ACLH0K_03955 [Arthrobacter sp. MPF02]|uniref:hypothetical protein n=1 Tax=Arthrobacter sp. MPF02 TaxID=3388492 RepID=UPI003985095C